MYWESSILTTIHCWIWFCLTFFGYHCLNLTHFRHFSCLVNRFRIPELFKPLILDWQNDSFSITFWKFEFERWISLKKIFLDTSMTQFHLLGFLSVFVKPFFFNLRTCQFYHNFHLMHGLCVQHADRFVHRARTQML